MQKIKNIFNKIKGNKKVLITISIIFVLLLLCGGITFAIFSYTNEANANNINSGHISFTYVEPSNQYIIKDALPMKDGEAMGLTNYFEFSVTTNAKTNDADNEGISIPYEITITESEGNTLTSGQIKMYLTEVVGENEITHTIPTLVSNLESSLFENIGTKVGFNLHLHRNGNETITTKYRLRAWIDFGVDATNWYKEDEHVYKFRINVNGEATYQGYETDSACFAFEEYDNNGSLEYQISGYDFNKCGSKNIVVPDKGIKTTYYKEITGIKFPDNDFILNVAKEQALAEDACASYGNVVTDEDWENCLIANGITLETWEEETIKSFDEFKTDASYMNDFIGDNYYDHLEDFEDYSYMIDLGMLIVETGEEIKNTSILKVSKIKSFINTDVVAVNNDKQYDNISDLNNIVKNDKIVKLANNSYLINGLIVPNDINIDENAFIDVEVYSLMDKTGNFPVSCFEYVADNSSVTIKKYRCSGVKNVRINSTIDEIPVTIIGESAFWSKKINSVVFNNNIVEIKSNAFNTNNLVSIVLPESLKTIGHGAFSTNKLSQIIIPDSITVIPSYSFAHNQLIELVIPNNVTIIEGDAFYYNQLIKVDLNNVVEIGNYAFSVNKLKEVIIPDSVSIIGYNAFANNQIENITLGKGVTNIYNQAFASNNIKYFEFPNRAISIGEAIFGSNPLKKLVLPSSVPVSNRNFYTNEIVTLVDENGDFPSSKCFNYTNEGESISIDGFNCQGLINLVIPEKIDGLPVTKINDLAISSYGIKKLELPKSINYIGDRAFRENKLKKVVIPNNSVYLNKDAFMDNKLSELVLPDSTKLSGSLKDYGSHLKVVNENGEFSIACLNFRVEHSGVEVGVAGSFCPSIKEFVIPNEYNGMPVIRINGHAFDNFGLNSVVIPDSVTSIEGYAFANNNLKSVKLPSKLSYLGNFAFMNNKLRGIKFPSGITYLGQQSFSTNEISSIKIPSTISYVHSGAFENNKISKLVIPDNITEIWNQAFANNNISSLSLPKNLTSIGRNAFKDNDLISVVIPENVTAIDTWAFYKSAESNPNLVKIVNKTGLKFEWNSIIDTFGSSFVTGVVTNAYGDVQIVAE